MKPKVRVAFLCWSPTKMGHTELRQEPRVEPRPTPKLLLTNGEAAIESQIQNGGDARRAGIERR
jgi:hypothetical protein